MTGGWSKDLLVVLAFAVGHRGLTLALAWATAFQAEGSWLKQAAGWLVFPLHRWQSASIDWSWRDELLFALVSLGWGLVACAVVGVVVWRMGVGKLALQLVGGLVVLGLAGVLVGWLPPDFSEVRRVSFQKHLFELPLVFQTSEDERYKREAIAKNIAAANNIPEKDAVPEVIAERYYWSYAATLSGHPEYRAVVVAATEEAAPNLERFRQELAAQEDPTWRAAPWEVVEMRDETILETALPVRAPLPVKESDRLVRVSTKQPWRGLWFGLVGQESKVNREAAVKIVLGAAQSCARTE